MNCTCAMTGHHSVSILLASVSLHKSLAQRGASTYAQQDPGPLDLSLPRPKQPFRDLPVATSETQLFPMSDSMDSAL
jgi:hypothetical protein